MTTRDNGHKECNDDAPTFDTLSISSIDIYLSSTLEKTRPVSGCRAR